MKKEQDIGIKVIMIATLFNIFLLVLKAVVGFKTHSTALQADAVNSAGDTISSIAILIGIKISLRPEDEDHHYGYGKIEALVSLFVGLLILASTGLLWRSIIRTFLLDVYYKASIYALIAAVISIVVKFYLYNKTMKIGKKINSIAVQTNAKDHRNDILATSGTIIAIALSLLGQQWRMFFLKYAESVAAAITSVFIIRAGFEIISSSVNMLIDAAPDDELIESFRQTVIACEGVQQLDWLKCRTSGRGILIDVAVEVDADWSVKEGHDVGMTIKRMIKSKHKTVLEVSVYINPDED